MKDVLKLLENSRGTYTGTGFNHENQRFHGTLRLGAPIAGKGLALEYRAVGDDGAVYHEERSLLGPGPDGSPSLWVMSSNHPIVFEHRFAEVSEQANASTITFQLGDLADKNAFRETIELELWKNGDISYRYSWGLPGGEFAARSGARLTREA